METTNRPPADMSRAFAQSATWYWDTLAETNRHVIDYMKSVTAIMLQANPMTVLTPMLRENENRAAQVLASAAQQPQHTAEQPVRHAEEPAGTRRKTVAPKATRRNATSARTGRRSK